MEQPNILFYFCLLSLGHLCLWNSPSARFTIRVEFTIEYFIEKRGG